MKSKELLKELNTAQYKAATVVNGNYLIAAGAGTGKTKVLTTRYIYLLDIGISAENICAFTFTKKAANEMQYRIKKQLGYDFEGTISTMHSFCYGYLLEEAKYLGFSSEPNIIDEDDSKKILKEIIKELNLDISEKNLSSNISKMKNHQKIDGRSLYTTMIENALFYEYQKRLKMCSLFDFDDLLYYFYMILVEDEIFREYIQSRYKYIMIDECQDTNKIQYEIITMMNGNNNLFMVGDQDQCIYSFRGSNLDNLTDFVEYKNATVLTLEENYRCGSYTLDAANKIISKNPNRIDKNLHTKRKENNNKVIYRELQSSVDEPAYAIKLINRLLKKGYKLNDFAILYRNNSQSIPFENELSKNNIPYRIIGNKPFYSYSEIKTLINYYRFLYNRTDDISLENIINVPSRGIGNVTVLNLKKVANDNNITLYEACLLSNDKAVIEFVELIKDLISQINTLSVPMFYDYLINKIDYEKYVIEQIKSNRKIERLEEFRTLILSSETSSYSLSEFINNLMLDKTNQSDSNDKINLLTIHQSKGLEFKIVIVAGCVQGIISPNTNSLSDLYEARNLMYVAITRAEDYLILLSYNQTFKNGKYINCAMSPFIIETGILSDKDN